MQHPCENERSIRYVIHEDKLDDHDNCYSQRYCLEDRIQFTSRRVGPGFSIKPKLPRKVMMCNLNCDDAYEEHFISKYIDVRIQDEIPDIDRK